MAKVAVDKPVDGVNAYYKSKLDELTLLIQRGRTNLTRLEAHRNDINKKVFELRQELYQLQQPASHVGEIIKKMGQNKVLVKINPDGKVWYTA